MSLDLYAWYPVIPADAADAVLAIIARFTDVLRAAGEENT